MNAAPPPPTPRPPLRCPHCGGPVALGLVAVDDAPPSPPALTVVPAAAAGEGVTPYPTDLIRTEEVTEMLGGIARESLDEIVAAGGIVRYRLTARTHRYSKANVAAYLAVATAQGMTGARSKVAARGRPRPE